MSNGNGEQKGFNPAEANVRMWQEFMSHAASANIPFSMPQNLSPENMKVMRSAMFKAIGSYWEEYMRSPEFLEMTKKSMNQMVEMKKQFNKVITDIHHELHSATQSDISDLVTTIGHAEEKFHESFHQISQRLDAMSDRLDKLENLATPKPPTPKTATKQAKKTSKRTKKTTRS